MSRPPQPAFSTAPLTCLLTAWLAGDVTTLETGRRIDRRYRELDEEAGDAYGALARLFPSYPAPDPDRAVVRLLMQALTLPNPVGDALTAIAVRRALLEAVVELEPGEAVVDVILRPGERILLGTTGGRGALGAILHDDAEPFVRWLDRTVLDPDAFASTTSDVPLHDLGNLEELIERLGSATEALAPGPARVMVADEWVAEATVAALTDDVPFADVARTIGETLLRRTAPILLWHAAHELALVAEDDPDLQSAVLERCLTVGVCEAGRCPAEAAAPLLGELGVQSAVRTLDTLAPRLSPSAWEAISKGFLRRELATQWHDWRDDVRRWSTEDDADRALAALDALVRAPAPEPGAIAWFTDSACQPVREASRRRLGVSPAAAASL